MGKSVNYITNFTARCTTLQSAVLLSYVVCPSVHLSVTLVDHDHIDWKSWRLIARAISRTSSLFVAHRSSTNSHGNMEKFWGDKRWGGKKWRAGAQKRQYLWNALRERKSYYGGPIGSHQCSFDFLGRRHISASSFASTAIETAVSALFLPIQPSNRYLIAQMDFLAANHMRIVGLSGQNWNQK